MNSSQRVVTSNHDNTVATFVQHTHSLDGVLLQRTLQNKESSKSQVGLDLISGEVVNPSLGEFGLGRKSLASEGKHSSTVTCEIFERLFVVRGCVDQHGSDGLRGTLDAHKGGLGSLVRLPITVSNCRDSALALQGRRELEASLDMNRLDEARRGTNWPSLTSESVISTKGPTEPLQGGLLHRIANDFTLIQFD